MTLLLYLASTSPYRRQLLARLGLHFMVAAPAVDETGPADEAPAQRALRLAGAKARAVSALNPGAWVLGSDQVADCDGQRLDKPGDAENCRRQLAACSGRAVVFHTAAVLLRGQPSAREEILDRTVVHFRTLHPAEIARYVESERPFDCAGSFRCEGLGIALFERIETEDPTALIGLPLIGVARALRRAGIDALRPDQP